MTAQEPVTRQHGNAYNIFILVLTIYSLAVMVIRLFPLDPDTQSLLGIYDNVICLIFIGDFVYNLAGSKPKRHYFIHQRGWLDLLGSIPSFGGSGFAGLLRLARLSRLARIGKLLQGKNRKALIDDVLKNRGEYATFITLLSAGMVLSIASVLMLQAEAHNADANIQTGGDAIWWGLATITTVGYGDRYPVTVIGRLIAMAVMFAGVGIIGALASILASMLVPPAATEEEKAADQAEEDADRAAAAADTAAILAEITALRAEIAQLREAVTAGRT